MPDSDDLDEDELLQLALQEQAGRNPTYQRTSNKPVVNLVQRPQPPSSSANRRQNQQMMKPQKKPVDYDDDSDVELLSISSGDEDLPANRGGTQRDRNGGDQRRGGGMADDDMVGDHDWDGEEPNCWKQVDEAELARRVREMRDTRAAPLVPVFNRKASIVGRKGPVKLQSMPRGVEAIDPLGLGMIDSRSLTLIKDSSENYPMASEDNGRLDSKTREKLNYYSEDFDAKLFLSRVHKNTPLTDLEGSSFTLKKDLKERTQKKKLLVKENFDCFVSCKTTIDDIESKLRQIEEDPEGPGTARLYDATQRINTLANDAFQPLFERQAQAEKIRSVQGMLQRFRTLFNLPSAIRGSISKGEYDLAVREYRKAKSIVLPSHVGILKRVLEEVEKVMYEFKAKLHRSMEDPYLQIADLENTVRLLIDLEPDSDPIWHYLNIQNDRIKGLLEKCTEDYDTRMEKFHKEIEEREVSEARWMQLQQNSNNSLNIGSKDSQLSLDAISADSTVEDALRERYIRRLTAVLLHHLPTFWRLALSVFSGKFAKVSTGSLILEPETRSRIAKNNDDDRVPDMKYSSHSLEEVSNMVDDTLSIYEAKVLSTFRDFEESNVLCTYMVGTIKDIAKACEVIKGKESAPLSAATVLCNLHFEITHIYILRLCSWMRTTIEGLSESWIPLSILERNNSPYTISMLPLEFRMISISAMDQICMMIQRLRSEATHSNDMLVQVQDMQNAIRLAFLNCFLDFSGYLEKLGGDLAQNRLNRTNSHQQKGYLVGSDGLSDFHSRLAVTDSHKRILMILSNIGYCKDELCDELYRKYMHIWLQPRGKNEQYDDIRDLVSSFSALENTIHEQYTFAKASSIRASALNYLLDSGIQWGAAPPVKGIRDSTIELMNTLVSVHAEVSSGNKPFLKKTLVTLVEGLMDTFISLFHEHESDLLKLLDSNGFCQLTLELEYFDTVLQKYFSSEARDSCNNFRDLLLSKASESLIESSETPGHRRLARGSRGSEDAMNDDRQPAATMAPDDLIALAQQLRVELLEDEIERTRLNILCFMESSPDPNPPVKVIPKPPYPANNNSIRGQVKSPDYRTSPDAGSFSRYRQRRR